ncbi:hypothetical protein A3A66_03010 [Microgenomates group bacterium RIFCSPLOWO2_01_FULL_46_13]|nr:MAG: hypothetical protein A2783_05225 [Microgenomates group bacterium RIFCSPHIGHO2_01_FULL_45_11]OGV95140.1 MAG: hypothetical protein A3A66_03010 [Microgenomates group bacterium RIFCSPLOWO2_01_FULL_46_13]
MRTVGELLKEARLKRKLTLADLSRQTRIQEKALKAVEENNFQNLPPATFVKGFVQNYARVVGVNPKTVLAIFRRDFIEDKLGRVMPRSLVEPIQQSMFTPRTTGLLLLGLLGLFIIGFFVRQVYVFTAAPRVTVTAPVEGAVVRSPIVVEGETVTDAMVAINNKEVVVDSQGKFRTELQLSLGEHTIVVVATDRRGKARTVQRVITVEE